MKNSFFLTILFTASLIVSIAGCNNDKHKKVRIQEVKLEDVKQEESGPEPPPPPSPNIEKCFVSDGLKYKTTITIIFEEKIIVGKVTSEELGAGIKETSKFAGTMKGDQLDVIFETEPPVIGDASRWTKLPWSIKKNGKKEILQVIFNAKNYETNKWGDTPYEFQLADCKE